MIAACRRSTAKISAHRLCGRQAGRARVSGKLGWKLPSKLPASEKRPAQRVRGDGDPHEGARVAQGRSGRRPRARGLTGSGRSLLWGARACQPWGLVPMRAKRHVERGREASQLLGECPTERGARACLEGRVVLVGAAAHRFDLGLAQPEPAHASSAAASVLPVACFCCMLPAARCRLHAVLGGRAAPQSRAACACMRTTPGPGADVEAASPVPAQMWTGVSPVPAQTWQQASPVPAQTWDRAGF
jgi:hypothetical protein